MINVLIVEDDINISNLHRRFTEKVEGYSVVGIANSIEDACDMIDILKPDLVLLDLYFPDGSGIEFLHEMRKKGCESDFILITAAREAVSLRDAMRGGAFDYIVKPVIFERFKKSLRRYADFRNELMSGKSFEQGDIDHILELQTEPHEENINDMPKGIDPITLKKIKSVIDENKNTGLSAEEVGAKIGASRNTARRYLEYLVASGCLTADMEYGTIGRPEKRYK